MDQEFEFKLIECLDAFERGESLDRILSRYPADAAQLRPLLQTAAVLPALRLEPSWAAEATARRSFLNQAAVLRERTEGRRWRLPLRLIAPLAALALVIVLFGRVIAASAAALPGDTLYPVKRTVEEVRLALTPDRTGLAKQIDQERRSEVAALLGAGRTAEVEFAGPIEAIERGGWVIAGLDVHLARDTQIDGAPALGRRAQIRGQVAGGTLTALSITVEPGGPPLSPTSTPTATATSTPRPTATPRPIATPTRTPRPTAPPTSEPTATPIPEPTLAPSATPRPPAPQPAPSPRPIPPPATTAPTDDANQNGDDNANGDGNDDHGGNGDDNGGDDHGGNDSGGHGGDDTSDRGGGHSDDGSGKDRGGDSGGGKGSGGDDSGK